MTVQVKIPNRPQNAPNDLEAVSVHTREKWSDPWTLEPFLFCNWVTWTASPSVSSAEFEWRYGMGCRQGETEFSQVPYRHLCGTWVKVVVEKLDEDGEVIIGDESVWIGIITDDGDNVHGSLNAEPAGVQRLLALGPEHLLEREIVAKMLYIRDGRLTMTYAAEPFNRDLKINANQADRISKKEHKYRVGNRSSQKGPDDVYVFAANDDFLAGESKQWSILDATEYLLEYFGPRDANGAKAIDFRLSDLWWVRDYVPTGGIQELVGQGKSVKSLLDQLFDRRRLLGYFLEPAPDDGDFFVLRPISFLDVEIEMDDDDLTVAQNMETVALLVDDAAAVEQLHLKESGQQRYDRVLAVGAPMLACATFGHDATNNLSLDQFWTEDEADAYDAAATATAGYADLEEFLKIHRNEATRAEERFQRVYTAFALSRNKATLKSGDRYSGEGFMEYFDWQYLVDAREGRDTSIEDDFCYQPGLRLSAMLPLRSEHDYRDDKIADNEIIHSAYTGAEWHYLSPLVIINTKDPDGQADWFQDVNQTGAAAQIETMGGGMGLTFGCNVEIPEGANYFQLRVAGQNQHFLAKNDYQPSPLLGYDEEPALYDWKTDLLATLAIVLPPIQVQWPAFVTGNPDFVRTLYIDAADWAALHYVAPHTVVAVEFGQLVRTNEGGLIRDDRGFLRRIARLAYEWYGRNRQAMTLTYAGATPICRVGDLIVEIGTGDTREDVRTVVTEVRIDFAQHDGDVHRTTLQTHWAELDVLRMLL